MPPRGRTAHKGVSWLLVGSLLGASASFPVLLHADDSHPDDTPAKQANKPADDADLMEFLGGIGGEDEAWINFLGRADPRKVAAASVPKRPPPNSAESSSSDSGSQKQ
jgi:hypothetical protein